MPTAPGIYVKEVSSGVHAITGVSTSLTAFIGTAARGPLNRLTRIQSAAEFDRTFGGLSAGSEMSYGVRHFFQNGGADAWVVRVAAGAANAGFALTALGGGPSNVAAGGPSLSVTAVDGGGAGNGVAVAVDASATDPNRFSLTVTGVPDANGVSASERYDGLSMNSQDGRFVERAVNGVSGLVTVKRDPAAAFDVGYSISAPPAAVALGGGPNTLRVAVNGASPTAVDLSGANTAAEAAAKINTALAAVATATAAGDVITIVTKTKSETASVQVLPGLVNDAARTLGFGAVGGGVEAGGAAGVQPAAGPAPGLLLGAAITPNKFNNHADGAISLTLDGGRAVTVPIALSDLTGDLPGVAARIQATVRAFRPTVAAYSRFAAVYDAAAKTFTLSSGTRGAGSAVAVAGTDALVADLGLAPGAPTAGGLWMLSGGQETALTSTNTYATYVPSPASKGGLYALENADLFNILCLPGVTDSATLADAAAYCEQRRAFLIVDPPLLQSPTDIEALVTGTTLPKSDHAAIYYPPVHITDPLTGMLRVTAPSGAIAGLFARTDATRGVWKAPAGTETNVVGAQQLEYLMTDGENGIINPVGANAIRVLTPYGIVVWGARTLRGADDMTSDYKFVPVRRLALYIEESLRRGLQWVVFEPNDEPLWAQIRLNLTAFMNTLFRQGAFQGQSPQEAFLVKCDKETTQQADIDTGVVNIVVGFAPLKPAEFVMLSITQLAGQSAS